MLDAPSCSLYCLQTEFLAVVVYEQSISVLILERGKVIFHFSFPGFFFLISSRLNSMQGKHVVLFVDHIQKERAWSW